MQNPVLKTSIKCKRWIFWLQCEIICNFMQSTTSVWHMLLPVHMRLMYCCELRSDGGIYLIWIWQNSNWIRTNRCQKYKRERESTGKMIVRHCIRMCIVCDETHNSIRIWFGSYFSWELMVNRINAKQLKFPLQHKIQFLSLTLPVPLSLDLH